MRKSELFNVSMAALLAGSLLVGDRSVSVVTATGLSGDGVGGKSGETDGLENKSANTVSAGDRITFRIVRVNNDVDEEMCATRVQANGWDQCMAFVGTDDRFVNSQPIDVERGLGVRPNGDYVEAYVERDGVKYYFDTRKIKSIVPDRSEGLPLYETPFSTEADVQPAVDMEGEQVVIEYEDGSKIYCRYRPKVGAMVPRYDAMGQLVKYENWEEGLFLVTGVKTHGGNCNTEFAAKNLKSITVGSKAFYAKQPFNGASLRGVIGAQSAGRRPVNRRTGRR